MRIKYLELMEEAGSGEGGGGGSAPAAPPPAANPTPAAPPPAPAAQPVADSDGAGHFEATHDAALDYALSYISGIVTDPNHAAFAAMEKGDFSLLEAEAKASGKPDALRVLAILQAKAAESKAANEAKAAEDKEFIFKLVGGEENFKAINEWSKANCDEAEVNFIAQTINSGGAPARLLAGLLNDAYRMRVGNQAPVPASPTRSKESAPVPSAGSAPLTLAEYTKAVQQLSRQLGSRMDSSSEYAALRARMPRR